MKNLSELSIILIFLASCLISCSEKSYVFDNSTYLLGGEPPIQKNVSSKGVRETDHSTPAGNLMADALFHELKLDIALYPRDLINTERFAVLNEDPSAFEIEEVLKLYPTVGNQDQFRIGLMRGRDIKKLLRTRIQDTHQLDIEVSGLYYNIQTIAGVVQSESYEMANGRKFADSEYYRVAINHHFFFSGETFPSYRFRNGLNFSFVPDGRMYSANKILRQYLQKMTSLPLLFEKRGSFSKYSLNYVGDKKTYEIQGNAHRSPLYAHKVTTTGIVTAIDNVEWYPRGVDVIIQDPNGDGVDETSDALNLWFKEDTVGLKVGDRISVTGTVYELMTLDNKQNMSKTVLRDITKVEKLDNKTHPLPAPVLIGKQGRPIPDRVLSTWVGDLNYKPYLNLQDGIDFWESLEGMRVAVRNPRVSGFRGGNEELVRLNPQRHLSLYIVPDGFERKKDMTKRGGITEDFMSGNFNPEVIHMAAGNLTADFNRLSPSRPRNLDSCEEQGGILYTNQDGAKKCQVPSGLLTTEYHYNIGDIFKGEVVGIVSFESNLFGGGEYTFVLPQPVYRYDKNVNNGPEAICVVRSLEYLNPTYMSLFQKNFKDVTCEEIFAQRDEVNDLIKNEIKSGLINANNMKSSLALGDIIRPSFATEEDGSPSEIINCLDQDLFSGPMPFECRPQTKLESKNKSLTVVAYNLENLAGNQDDRIEMLGKAIRNNLKCPDIISLIEIQDNNGWDFEGGNDASITLDKVIKATRCDLENVVYKPVNINPLNHNEGGQPGGNIRVAMIYNSTRVNFTPKGQDQSGPLGTGALLETNITPEGNLSVNPGRVFPNNPSVKNTRKSIVAQFEFMGEKVFVIGNHFNSKLGDASFWGSTQPPFPLSDINRTNIAVGVNNFVQLIESREPKANVIVLGDFNAYHNERSMLALGGDGVLNNLMFHGNLTEPEDRYTHNFNGNSGAIDFIFANRRLLRMNPRFESIHINSDYMGRLADHDPVIAQFNF